MKSYSYKFDKESYASARLEGVDASHKDLIEVCGRIRNKNIEVAIDLLEKASNMELPILYKRYNKRLGHRRELGGQKGRYPQKAVKIVLKILKNAIASGRQKGFDSMLISHISANRKFEYPRLSSKGRRSRQGFGLSRIEIVLKKLTELSKEVKKAEKHANKDEAKEAEIKKVETKDSPEPKTEQQSPPQINPEKEKTDVKKEEPIKPAEIKKTEKPRVKLKDIQKSEKGSDSDTKSKKKATNK